jgi:phosphoglycolate phosphatase-like HAD superfamily hydrolase
MRFKYMLWDFDGTLFDTYPPLIEAIENALGESGIGEPRELITRLLDDTMSACVTALTDKHGLDAAAFAERIRHYWGQTTPQENPPFPGAIFACERILAAGGRNYIVTHRGRESLVALLDWYQVTGLFADCLTRDDGYPRKPDPASFQAMIEKHGLPREEVLAIGDRTLDILAGQAAGVHTCLFSAQPGPDMQPDYVIATFDELGALLGLG